MMAFRPDLDFESWLGVQRQGSLVLEETSRTIDV